MKTDEPIKCPSCGGDCRIEWSGLDLVENSGDETLATKHYISIADQQNKELRDELSKMKAMFDFDKTRAEITRLTKENKELEEKLMSEQIENGYLQAFRVSNEAEIQRLTKEVEELRRINEALRDNFPKVAYTTDANDRLNQELARLRELLKQYLNNSTSDNAHGANLRDQLFNALNHKP